MEFFPSDTKKKDPDSFSLDPEVTEGIDTSESTKKAGQIEVDINIGPVLSSIIASPKLPTPKHLKVDSFSIDDVKNSPPIEEISNFPVPLQLTLNLCKAFNKEAKVTKKINNFINTMNENLKLTEQLVKTQENRIDEFFQEVYDLFIKNFQSMTEVFKQNLKNRLKQEYDEYRFTHEMVKTNLDYIMTHDSFSKVLQQELLNLANPNSQLNLGFPLASNEAENKTSVNDLFTQFMNNTIDLNLGLTPLVKKFKLIEYSIESHLEKPILSQNISPNASEIKKEPLKDFANIYAELESFVAKVSTNFSQEISTISHPHAPFISTIEKIVKCSTKTLPFDATGKSYTQIDPEETLTRKRLSQFDPNKAEIDEEELEKDKEYEKDSEKEKEPPRSPPLSSRSVSETGRVPPTLTPVKNVTYKVPIKENSFTADAGWFNSEDMGEISYQTQLISVHNHLSVGDLISISGVPYRILYKEWIFPEDIVQMVNIFTGEILEVKYNSRYTGMEDQIITKKYEVIKINNKKGYYLLMDMNWDKADTCKRLPNVIEMKNVLDKKLEDDIRDCFNSDKKVVVHVLKIKDKDIILSYRKEWI